MRIFYALYIPAVLFLSALPAPAINNRLETAQESADLRACSLLEKAGLDAAGAHDYADAAIDLRRAAAVEPGIPWIWAELGLVLDKAGKCEEAFRTYQKAFGLPIGSTFGTNSCLLVEALTRYGLTCEERGLHEKSVQCFNKAREWADSGYIAPLDKSLDAKTASPSVVRMMLNIVRGVALEQAYEFGPDRSADALAAFGVAIKLAPEDPRPLFFLAYGLRHAGKWAEAESVLRRVAIMDTSGSLKSATADSLKYAQQRWPY